MPVYEYECQKCKKITEALQKISEPAPKACVHCNKGPLQKIMSRTVFKNSPPRDEFEGVDHIAEHNAYYDQLDHSNTIIDETGHRVEVDADDPRLKSPKVS